jgi:polar amino acid transport system substrate-binding protein
MKIAGNIKGKLAGLFAVAFMAASSGAMAQADAKIQGDLARILETKVARFGAVEAFPYYKHDLKTDEWVGIIPDLARAIFEPVGVKVEFITTDWGNAAAGLQSGRFDLIGAYNATPQRALAVDFTQPISQSRLAVLSLKQPGPEYASWKTLNTASFKLAGVEGAATTRAAQKMLPNATWTLVKAHDAMILELESGRVDAIASNDPTILMYMQAKGQGHMSVPQSVISSPVNIAMRRGNVDLRDWLNTSIQYYQADGTFKAIWDKYLPEKK